MRYLFSLLNQDLNICGTLLLREARKSARLVVPPKDRTSFSIMYQESDKLRQDIQKGNYKKIIINLLILVIIYGITSFISSLFVKPSTSGNQYHNTENGKQENYAPQNMDASANSVQVQGNGNTINQYPPPRFAYKVMSPSKMSEDGLYHTYFVLSVGFAPGTARSVLPTQNYLAMKCTGFELPFSMGPKPSAIMDTGGDLLVVGNQYYDCTSQHPLVDDGNYFSLSK